MTRKYSKNDVKSGIIVYIDILGSKLKSKDAEELCERANILSNFQNEVALKNHGLDEESLKGSFGKCGKIEIIHMSDAIVIIFPDSFIEEILKFSIQHDQNTGDMLHLYIFSYISLVQSCFILNNGQFMRGGIAYGSYIYDDKKPLLMGKALDDAYTTESNDAIFPIIALHETMVEFTKCFLAQDRILKSKYGDTSNFDLVKYVQSECCPLWFDTKNLRNPTDLFFIDYANATGIDENGQYPDLQKHLRLAKNQVKNNQNNEHIRIKYEFIIRYLEDRYPILKKT